jgi:hypothetical protein
MQPCNRIYYSTFHWRLNMFWVAYHSSSEALTVFVASGLHTHVVTDRSQVPLRLHYGQVPLRLDYGRSPHVYVNQRLQIQLELLMMSSMPLETCWAFNERWNNKFYYKVASCWLFLLSHTTMHRSMNIKGSINYWVISLSSATYKILSIILLSRCTPLADEIICIISVDCSITGQKMFIYSVLIKYLKYGNGVRQYISYLCTLK